jgi:hypothetical protein
MGIFDWLRIGQNTSEEPVGMSRRDFFTRIAGREPEPTAAIGANTPGAGDALIAGTDTPDPDTGARVLYTFHLADFPYYDGPVLVPALRAGDEYRIGVDPPYSRNPTGLRIERGRECLGIVPDDVFPDVLQRMRAGETIVCRALEVNPAAELARVLTVQILLMPPEEEGSEAGPEENGREPTGSTEDAERAPSGSSRDDGPSGGNLSASE